MKKSSKNVTKHEGVLQVFLVNIEAVSNTGLDFYVRLIH